HATAQVTRAAGGQVDQGAVVPEHQVVVLPLVAVDEFRLGAVGEQLPEQFAALVFRQVEDVGGEILVDEQPLAAGFRMGTHHRMDGRLDLGDLLGGQGRTADAGEHLVGIAGDV